MPIPTDILATLPLVYVDTNHNWLGPGQPAIGTQAAFELNLVPGQVVLAYAPPEDAWTATVHHDPSLEDWCAWWVQLEEDVDYNAHVHPRVQDKWKTPHP